MLHNYALAAKIKYFAKHNDEKNAMVSTAGQ
jgi:hypothetical protein